MKKLYSFLLAAVLLTSLDLNAQIDTQDVGSETITPTANADDDTQRPFKVSVSGDYISKAKIRRNRKCPNLGDITFATGQALFNAVFCYNDCYEEGAALAIAYDRIYMNWNENPYFNQKNIDQISLILSGFSKRLCNWEWRAQAAANFDNIRYWNFQNYMNYDFVLWGRYAYCENFGLNIGFWAQTGMKYDRVYPIVGIDWQYDCHWKFNAIFPMNFSAIYAFNSTWSVAVASRFFDQRHRVNRHQPLSGAFYHYQSTGGEFAVNYTPGDFLNANIHVGYDFGGHLTIRSRHYHHPRRFCIGAAPYAGAEIDVRF